MEPLKINNEEVEILGGKMLNAKPKPEARPGNIALDIERPLFNEGPNWEF